MLYLTISNFTKNTLWESASACAFGFIFSFIPIILIIFAVLSWVLRVSPNIYNFIISFLNEFENIVDIQPLLKTMANTNSINIFNIFLGIWVIWMARKLFNSIILSMTKIFRAVSKRKSWFNQLLTFISEFFMTILIIVIVIAAFAFSRIISMQFFQTIFERFPILFAQTSHNLGLLIIYFILFLSTAIAYRVLPGTKPMIRRCIFYAALNAVSFFVASYFINLFLNVTNYNTIYGTISSLVLLMMKVYIFFILFLFFAQMLYVSQFFKPLLQSEIYQLPASESKGIQDTLRRFLFINPAEIQTKQNTVFLNSGEKLFTAEENVTFIYYIKKGELEILEKERTILSQGNFLGDIQCLLNEPYGFSAKALSSCELIKFSSEEFMQIINKSHHAALKAISKISNRENISPAEF